jgi:hypothetical protein
MGANRAPAAAAELLQRVAVQPRCFDQGFVTYAAVGHLSGLAHDGPERRPRKGVSRGQGPAAARWAERRRGWPGCPPRAGARLPPRLVAVWGRDRARPCGETFPRRRLAPCPVPRPGGHDGLVESVVLMASAPLWVSPGDAAMLFLYCSSRPAPPTPSDYDRRRRRPNDDDDDD